MIKTLMKWLGVALLLYIVWFFMKNTIVEYLTKWELHKEGLVMQKNEWGEFDLDNVSGETPASLFHGLQSGQAILKYRFELMYPFDGKIGFYGGSDRSQLTENTNIEFLDTVEKNETAYLFRTIDDGKSFTRQSLGHGVVNALKRYANRYYLNVHEADTYKDHTFTSDDLGAHWHTLGDFRIEALFDTNRFIYSKTKSLSISERETTYYYTKDGGKTGAPLNAKLLNYLEQSSSVSYDNRFHIYQGKLVFLVEDKLISVDIDTLQEQNISLKKPPHQLFDGMDIDPESGRLYIFTKDDDFKPTQKREFPQLSVWFPFEDIFVKFDKGLYEDLGLRVRGNYIGGLMHYRGILTHIWTMDYGKTWEFEVLPHYFWTALIGYGNNRIYMTAYVQGKKGVKKGTYLIMGKIK